ncbi:hypothetical protein ZHAS_00012582 [Anopheles sinensis]|uniref:Uncharacterized protein n=1 Tax=Anopheles sinensis TaxID=74873 RepID=A0A084W382_ANOSI|nr:hypothetical protein ZHAS_00012582 [Anopheles sinensis]
MGWAKVGISVGKLRGFACVKRKIFQPTDNDDDENAPRKRNPTNGVAERRVTISLFSPPPAFSVECFFGGPACAC